MVVVVVVMFTLMLAATAVAAVVMNTTGIVKTTQSTAQSRTAADAGISAAVAQIVQYSAANQDFCTTDDKAVESDSSPHFAASWTCNATTTELTVTSTGYGDDDSSQTTVTAVYAYTPAQEAEAAVVGGTTGSETQPVIMQLASGTVSLGQFTISNEEGVEPTVVVGLNDKSADFSCNATIDGDLIVVGNYTSNSDCHVTGNLVVGGNLSVTGGTTKVDGNVTVVGSFASNSTATITGDLVVGGDMTIPGGTTKVSGDVTVTGSFNAQSGNAEFVGDLWAGKEIWAQQDHVAGNIISGGDVNAKDLTVGGSITLPEDATLTLGWNDSDIYKSTTSSQPSESRVPGGVIWKSTNAPEFRSTGVTSTWYDYEFDASDWPGYDVVTLSANGTGADSCYAYSDYHQSGWEDLAKLTKPTVIDARNCGTTFSPNRWHMSVELPKDVVLLANGFSLYGITMTSASESNARLWLITEDTTADRAPTCDGTKSGLEYNGVNLSGVTTMIYTPCTVKSSGGGTLHGSLYAGNFDDGGNFTLIAAHTTLPGLGSGSGLPTDGSGTSGTTTGSAATAPTLGALISQRDTE